MGFIPPNSAGWDPDVVPELRRGFKLNLAVLGVALATFAVALVTLLVAVLTR
jgi:hypothetical protein